MENSRFDMINARLKAGVWCLFDHFHRINLSQPPTLLVFRNVWNRKNKTVHFFQVWETLFELSSDGFHVLKELCWPNPHLTSSECFSLIQKSSGGSQRHKKLHPQFLFILDGNCLKNSFPKNQGNREMLTVHHEHLDERWLQPVHKRLQRLISEKRETFEGITVVFERGFSLVFPRETKQWQDLYHSRTRDFESSNKMFRSLLVCKDNNRLRQFQEVIFVTRRENYENLALSEKNDKRFDGVASKKETDFWQYCCPLRLFRKT